MTHANSHREKREIQYNTHNRRSGVAKFKRNLSHRKRRRLDSVTFKYWVQERDNELGESISAARRRRNINRERTEGEMPPA